MNQFIEDENKLRAKVWDCIEYLEVSKFYLIAKSWINPVSKILISVHLFLGITWLKNNSSAKNKSIIYIKYA